jgi:aspartokinase-like uncharacterized kinase
VIPPRTEDPPSGPVVVKIGGGLLREQGLEGLRDACAEATELATNRPVLVVPGGGPFADAVRAVDGLVGLGDATAHALALRAMDQLGVLLRPLLPAAELLAQLVVPRALGLLEAAPAFTGRPDVPESWTVTSDSLAVLAAAAIGADEAVLLKSTDGLLARWPSHDPPVSALTTDELDALQARGGAQAVDTYLAKAVRRTGVTVVLRRPGSGSTSGTRITPG